jgi:putative peptidoglycan lipid II flippase
MTLGRKALSAGILLSLAILVGRAAGFLREIQIASVFGLSEQADLAVILLTTPDLMLNLLLSGGLSAALIPEFTRLAPPERSALFYRASLAAGALFALIGGVIAVAPQTLLLLLAPAYAASPPAGFTLPFAITAIALPFAALTGVTGALLNAEQRFFVVGAGTLIFNAVIISVLLLAPKTISPLLALATGVALACIARYGSQFMVSLPHLRLRFALSGVDVRLLMRRFLATLTASTLILLMPVILRTLISFTGNGNIAAFNFATKLVELPSGIVLGAISTVAFSQLARLVAAGNESTASRIFADRAMLSVLLAIAIMVPAIWFAEPIAALLFGFGKMGAAEVRQIGDLARICFLTLPGVALTGLAVAMLNAHKRTAALLLRTAVAVVAVVGFALPGLLTGRAELIVLALPLAQALLASLLIHALKDLLRGRAVADARPWLALAAVLAISALFIVVDQLAGRTDIWFRVGLAGLAMLIALLTVIALVRPEKEDDLVQTSF